MPHRRTAQRKRIFRAHQVGSRCAEPIEGFADERLAHTDAPADLCREFVKAGGADGTCGTLWSFGKGRCHGEMIPRVHSNGLVDNLKIVIQAIELAAHSSELMLDRRRSIVALGFIEETMKRGGDKAGSRDAELVGGRR